MKKKRTLYFIAIRNQEGNIWRIAAKRRAREMALHFHPDKLRRAGFQPLTTLLGGRRAGKNLVIRLARAEEPAFKFVKSGRYGKIYFRNRRTRMRYARPAQWICMEEMKKLYTAGFRYNVWYTVEV